MLRLFAALLLLFVSAGYTQEITNTVKYDYSMLHNRNGASVNRHFAQVNYTQAFAKSRLVYTAAWRQYNLDYNMLKSPFTTANLENITAVQLGISYLHRLGSNWEGIAGVTPEIVSNFKNAGIQDVYPGFFIGARKTTTGAKASVLTFGVGYKGYFGKYTFMPILNYHKNISEKLSYTVGIPAMDLTYKLSETHIVKAVAFADAFYTKVRGDNYVYNPLQENSSVAISTLKMLTFNGGLEYNYLSGGPWTGTLKASYSFYNNLTLTDKYNNDHDIDFKNNIYISVGFKYNLNF